MDKAKRFFELKKLWKRANEAERGSIDVEIKALLDSMSEEELSQLTNGISADLERINKEAKEITNVISIRQQMENVLPVISVSYLAKHYFGKSSSWFYQRLNGNKVHGKVCKFTQEEIQILNKALKDISCKIDEVHLEFN